MWLFRAPGTHHGHLQRSLALGREAPEPAIILSGSEFSHSAPNCTVMPFSEAAFTRLASAATVVLFDVQYHEYAKTERQRTVLVQRTPNVPSLQPDVDLILTAGVYERVPWEGLVTEAWINPVADPKPRHEVVVVATGERTLMSWFVRATVALLEHGHDALLVAPIPVDGVPSVVSDNAVDWIASADVVVSMAGLTMYEALHHGVPFVGSYFYEDCRVRLEIASRSDAVVQIADPRMAPSAVDYARTLLVKEHPNGVPAALAAIERLWT